jgi:hypothetical protein
MDDINEDDEARLGALFEWVEDEFKDDVMSAYGYDLFNRVMLELEWNDEAFDKAMADFQDEDEREAMYYEEYFDSDMIGKEDRCNEYTNHKNSSVVDKCEGYDVMFCFDCGFIYTNLK